LGGVQPRQDRRLAADSGGELEDTIEVRGLIALKSTVRTADALHRNRRTVLAIIERGSVCCLALSKPTSTRCYPTPGPVSASYGQTNPQRGSKKWAIDAMRPAQAW